MRITKVTTKTGDKGDTSLGTGQRVRKDHPRVNVLGELDHLNSIIGWTISSCEDSELIKNLKNIQQDIFNISGDISLPGSRSGLLKKERLCTIEEHIDKMTKNLPPLKEFILPGGSEFISRLHISKKMDPKIITKIITLKQNITKSQCIIMRTLMIYILSM